MAEAAAKASREKATELGLYSLQAETASTQSPTYKT